MNQRVSPAVFITELLARGPVRITEALYFSDQHENLSKRDRRRKSYSELPEALQLIYSGNFKPSVLSNREKNLMKVIMTCELDNLPDLEDEEQKLIASVFAPLVEPEKPTVEILPIVPAIDLQHSYKEPESNHNQLEWDELRLQYNAARASSDLLVGLLNESIETLSAAHKKVKVNPRLEYLVNQRFKNEADRLKVPMRLWQTSAAITEERKRSATSSAKKAKAESELRRKSGYVTLRSASSLVSESESAADSRLSEEVTTSQLQQVLETPAVTAAPTVALHAATDRSTSRIEAEPERAPLHHAQGATLAALAGLQPSVRFALSSNEAAEKGWIFSDSRAMYQHFFNLLEWCVDRLRFSRRSARLALSNNVVIQKFDGRSQRAEVFKLAGSKATSRYSVTAIDWLTDISSFEEMCRRVKPNVPVHASEHMRSTQLVILPDKTATVFYPSGRVCLLRSASTESSNDAATAAAASQSLNQSQRRFHTIVFADQDELSVLAAFRPNGNGFCCQLRPKSDKAVQSQSQSDSTLLRMQLSSDSYTVYDENEVSQKTMQWPNAASAKLPGTVIIPLASTVTFRCDARNDAKVTVHAAHGKEVFASFDVSPCLALVETSETEVLQSAVQWKSKSAQDIVMQMQSMQTTLNAPGKSKRRSVRSGETKSGKAKAAMLQRYQEDLERLRQQSRQVIDNWCAFYSQILVSSKATASGDSKLSRSFTMPELTLRSAVGFTHSRTPYWQLMRPYELLDGVTLVYTPCPVLTRAQLRTRANRLHTFALPSFNCYCSTRHITQVTDLEFDLFIKHGVSARQLVVVVVVAGSTGVVSQSLDSSLSLPANYLLMHDLFVEMNMNRVRPCFDGANDSYRIVEYDLLTATRGSASSQPLLVYRHNVSSGAVLIYQNSRLIFCDHLLNGRGHSRADFHMQIQKTLRDSATGFELPADFKMASKVRVIDLPAVQVTESTPPPVPPAIRILITCDDSVALDPQLPVSDNSLLVSGTVESSSKGNTTRRRRNSRKAEHIDVNLLSANLLT